VSRATVSVSGPSGSVHVELEDESRNAETVVEEAKKLINWLTPNPNREPID
jgi:hypothetical protein